MKQKYYKSKFLQRNNILFTIIIIVCNVLSIAISDSDKNSLIGLNIFFSCLLFFLYRFRLNSIVNKHWLDIKKELMYINYPVTIGVFFALLFIIFCFDLYQLSTINKDALNSTFILTYFMSTISVLMPSMFLLVYMYLFNPAIILPAFEKRKRTRKSDLLVMILFILFLLFSITQFVEKSISKMNILKKEKYKAVKLTVQYPDQHLKYTNLSVPVINKLKREKLNLPFSYTKEGYKFSSYEAAEQFCNSMNAKVASHKEIYNIIFHRFDTFGEKYYWTSDKAGRNNLVLHFKNMSYEIVKKPSNVSATVYCTSKASDKYNIFDEKYFFKNKPVEIELEKQKVGEKKTVKTESSSFEKAKYTYKKNQYPPKPIKDNMPTHVNFNVKHVTQDYFRELLNEGYTYNSEDQMNSYYSSNERKLRQAVSNHYDKKHIKLCYFPFIESENISITDELQIWRQNFCSPSFEVINETPEIKSASAKEAFCYANGGRLPNIPELMGIIRTHNNAQSNTLFWVKNKINNKNGVAVEVDGQKVHINTSAQNAYTYCIKPSVDQSKIISNFKSKFSGINGNSYARSICPSCKYYEVPDTVLIKY